MGFYCDIDTIYTSKYKLAVAVQLCALIPTNPFLLIFIKRGNFFNKWLIIHYKVYSQNSNTAFLPEKCSIVKILLNESEFSKILVK